MRIILRYQTQNPMRHNHDKKFLPEFLTWKDKSSSVLRIMRLKGLSDEIQRAALQAAITGNAWSVISGASLNMNDPNMSGVQLLEEISHLFYTPANR